MCKPPRSSALPFVQLQSATCRGRLQEVMARAARATHWDRAQAAWAARQEVHPRQWSRVQEASTTWGLGLVLVHLAELLPRLSLLGAVMWQHVWCITRADGPQLHSMRSHLVPFFPPRSLSLLQAPAPCWGRVQVARAPSLAGDPHARPPRQKMAAQLERIDSPSLLGSQLLTRAGWQYLFVSCCCPRWWPLLSWGSLLAACVPL